ncbi:hypothetical protein [Flammeovirga kamogawensis]|uniref:Lipoprotein n=1 Tax=Flammeovirga kamogawensis TaxID=373891 RepID=A0ABX8H2Z2_9BACT|nr:hypothetical protein [Flammeovirga kamogawensis]MBB6460177.1 hypothetical protein [Flammeovirga kamogawensis]QWG09989.1 hypothetical protein KM029_20115 [Flammeovirga kamogawensis]TRX65497.1 hypothetical protein EO216_23540 [Flammeovirga kamogawensis]
MRAALFCISLLIGLVSCTETPSILPKDPNQIQLIKDTVEESPTSLDTTTVIPTNQLIIHP